ncbi:hypothetical protein BBO99_00006691 [Phytophthora kernoviae]|uniref:Ribosomal RNA-processing protein 8 n=2 Tax=Phytophthora kernoviae TaxID=325452 RepID=A0A3R7KAK8_9STRA|nr:hypothetical protein G195_003560 [Phytophthora kernoviae 00238/432]KAG2522263.1 hypothetical protein JM16_002218 [Phytophthora kernoviae]KAG2522859.1 hypothetical protein JM18_003938 [Phytophthora kernoviae]RLN44173.1 hypothetical protein BBI17_002639 [Phytophthora kernoviae]RLN77506.1 hypothetical protein BBO99_00006691 [Phytophthora kernoviae]
MAKKRRGGAGKSGAKGKPTASSSNKKAHAKNKTQQVSVVLKSQQKTQQSKQKGKPKAMTASDRLAEMRRRLDGGKFRMLNEQLYTSTGEDSFSTFQEDPELFDVYHQGFREQADKWPVNPLDTFIDYVKRHPKAVVADFGCGDARLAESVSNKVHSFDLVSRKPHVTACNIADVPLKDSSTDIGVYCLALMGKNVREYVREVYRVLKPGGVLKVAEVKSRFESESLGGIDGFVEVLHKMGFDCKNKDERNKMFVLFEFIKSTRKAQDAGPLELKACEYKRR